MNTTAFLVLCFVSTPYDRVDSEDAPLPEKYERWVALLKEYAETDKPVLRQRVLKRVETEVKRSKIRLPADGLLWYSRHPREKFTPLKPDALLVAKPGFQSRIVGGGGGGALVEMHNRMQRAAASSPASQFIIEGVTDPKQLWEQHLLFHVNSTETHHRDLDNRMGACPIYRVLVILPHPTKE
jgi:hypothetical protein